MATTKQSKPSFLQRHKLLYRLSISIAGLMLACCLVLFYIIHFESGTAFAWKTAKSIMGESLSGDLIEGRLQDGIQMDNFRFKNQDTDIQIDQIRSRWNWNWSDKTLTINQFNLGTIKADIGPSKDDTSTPLSLPDNLSLPITIHLQDISFDQLIIGKENDDPLIFKDLAISGHFTQTEHSLTIPHVSTPWGQIVAEAKVATQQPFNTTGYLQMSGNVEHQPFNIDSKITGTLSQLGIDIAAQGGQIVAGNVQLQLRPFDAMPLYQMKADIAHFNPKLLSAGIPEADLSAHADLSSASADAFNLRGTISVHNNLPGVLQHDRLPIQQFQASVDLKPEQQSISNIVLNLLDKGTIKGSGTFSTNDSKETNGELNLTADNINLHTFYQELHTTRLKGSVQLTLKQNNPHLLLDLKDKVYGIYANAGFQDNKLTIESVKLAAIHTVLDMNGELSTTDSQPYHIEGKLTNLNPALWVNSQQPRANISGMFKAEGKLATKEHTIQFKIAPKSLYGDIPIIGQGLIQLVGEQLKPSHANLSIANNHVTLKGSLGNSQDVLHVNIDAPNLSPLGYGLSGRVKFDGTFKGKYTSPHIESTIDATNVNLGQYAISNIHGSSQLHIDLDHKLNTAQNTIDADITLQGLKSPLINLANAELHASGSGEKHNVSFNANGDIKDKSININTRLTGKILYAAKQDQYGWEGIIQSLDNKSGTDAANKRKTLPNIHLVSPLTVHYLAGDIQLGKGVLQINNSTLTLQQLTANNGEISSSGTLTALDIRMVLDLIETFSDSRLPVRSNMVLNGQWNFKINHNATGFIEITKDKGDLFINNGEAFVPMNLTDLHLKTNFEGKQMRLSGEINSQKLGILTLQGTTSLQANDQLLTVDENSRLNLQLTLNQPSLTQIGNLYGPQLRLEGAVEGKVAIQGQIKSPLISGQITGKNLAFSLLDQGIALNDGAINLVLSNNILTLQQFEFHGGKGTLQIVGKLDLINPQSNMQAKATANKLEIFASPTRQLALSGEAILSNINRKLELDGKINIDNALFDIPKSSAPTLDDDVIIVDSSVDVSNSSDPVPESAFIPRVKLDVDLGPKFYFKDAGADLQLTGILHIIREENQGLTGQGTIHASGLYEAFGTKLNIEQGLINFQGPLNNPDMNIRAMTQNQEVEAGVEVTGNANHPRIKLVSEPNVADEEKLSWLMFGKGSGDSDITQSQATSQALAAIGTYGGSKFVKGIGFDQFSIGASDAGLSNDQVVSVGKSITRKISIGIEKALTGPDSIAKFTWNFSRRWSLVLKGGTVNGINLTHNRRFD